MDNGQHSPKKTFSWAVLNGIRLLYVDTPKLGLKIYRHFLNMSNLCIDIFTFFEYKKYSYKVRIW